MDYYANKLSGERLKLCYDIAAPRVKQYLKAELEHVLKKIKSSDIVLELGCGYGRIIPALASKAKWVVGIDTSFTTLIYAKIFLKDISNYFLCVMDADKLSFIDDSFDIVVCIQNGISAFHTDREKLLKESIRVVRPGGIVLFSSYSDKFWNHRLEWFRLQSEAGLVGKIDYTKTKAGNIVCKDGFTASTVSANEFIKLAESLSVEALITEVDQSSIFCEITVLKTKP